MDNNITPPPFPGQVPPPPTPVRPQSSTSGKPGGFTSTLGFKILFIVLLSLLLLIPDAFLFALIDDREERLDDTVTEISSSWGGKQIIAGPMVTIPYRWPAAGADSVGTITLLPATLDAKATLESQKLSRSIYETVVYNSDITLTGNFTLSYLSSLHIPLSAMQLDRATVILGVGDLKGVATLSELSLGASGYELEGAGQPAQVSDEVYSYDESASSASLTAGITLPADPTAELPFSFTMSLKGSREIGFAPVGKRSTIEVSGQCSTPSFGGLQLPVSREVKGDEFTALWQINAVNRSYPQAFTGSADIDGSAVTVGLLVPVDSYQKTSRALKYATIVILLTFMAVLFAETVVRRPINTFQYLLVGLALVLFYSLLLSLSEHIGFGPSYLVAALLTIGLVGLYMRGAIRSAKAAAVISAVLALIYAFIYVLLNLETYALLAGSLGLFVALAAIMWASLRMKWRITD